GREEAEGFIPPCAASGHRGSPGYEERPARRRTWPTAGPKRLLPPQRATATRRVTANPSALREIKYVPLWSPEASKATACVPASTSPATSTATARPRRS